TASKSMTVQDAIAKSSVVVKVTSDSQIKKLPPEMAQRIAMRLKATSGKSGDQAGGNAQGQQQLQGQGQRQRQDLGSRQGSAPAAGGTQPGAATESQASRGPGGNGPPDFQRLLSRLPNS